MSPELNNVLSEVVKVLNHVKANDLNSRLFTALCNDMGADYKQLLLHADVRWLSRGNVLSRLFELLRNELAMFHRGQKNLVTIVPRCGLASQASLFSSYICHF